MWDIIFYPSKSQIVTFAGQNPCQYQLVLNGNPVYWINRVKYLGVHFIVIRAVVNEQTSIRNSMVSLIVACQY